MSSLDLSGGLDMSEALLLENLNRLCVVLDKIFEFYSPSNDCETVFLPHDFFRSFSVVREEATHISHLVFSQEGLYRFRKLLEANALNEFSDRLEGSDGLHFFFKQTLSDTTVLMTSAEIFRIPTRLPLQKSKADFSFRFPSVPSMPSDDSRLLERVLSFLAIYFNEIKTAAGHPLPAPLVEQLADFKQRMVKTVAKI
ncbi:MAG: hypothetical protein ACD_28C00133G0004 [uncultured bacterium]|nr:MAG: hypothetical protein ACD_28C00133G0004 [uncultured bacterium]